MTTTTKRKIIYTSIYKKWKGFILSDIEPKKVLRKVSKVKTGGFSLQVASNFGVLH